jgi:glycosyl transferase family 25
MSDVAKPPVSDRIPPIWVVNLKRSTARREYISAHLTELGLRYEIVEGVDGQLLSDCEIEAVYSPRLAQKITKRPLTRGEIGCCLSQLKLYRRMVDENVSEVLIMDDDAYVQPVFFDVMGDRDRFPKDWDLILLWHGGAVVSRWGARSVGVGSRVVKFGTTAWGTTGYLIKQSAALKLLAQGYPIRAVADDFTGGGIRVGLRLYGINPPCVREVDHGPASVTTMPDAHVQRHREPTPDDIGAVRWGLRQTIRRLTEMNGRYNPLAIR